MEQKTDREIEAEIIAVYDMMKNPAIAPVYSYMVGVIDALKWVQGKHEDLFDPITAMKK